MKLTFISLFIFLPLMSFVSNAQLKIGYVDSDTIMDNYRGCAGCKAKT